jgi:chorismate dehydratase
VILLERFGVRPEIVEFDARERVPARGGAGAEWPESLLLIGDKVVTDSPPAVRYPHQLDLGEAWRDLTGLPFVYAAWMCRAGEEASARVRLACALLDRQRRHNATRMDWIIASRAPQRRWPTDLARTYVRSCLRYDLGDPERRAVEMFFDRAHAAGALARRRPTRWAQG